MVLGKSIKMYLTIFVATTCVYMVLYQYHISREPIPSPEVSKSKNILAESLTETENSKIATASLMKRYNNIFLGSPSSLVTSSSEGSSSSPLTSLSSPSSISSPSSTLLSSTAIPFLKLSPVLSSSISSSTTTQSILVPKKALVTLKVMKPSTQLAPVAPIGYNSSDKADNKVNTSSFLSYTAMPITITKTGKFKNNNSLIQNNMNNIINNNYENDTISTITTRTTTTNPRTTNKTTKIIFSAASVPPPLYIITPTYKRPEQLAELVRMGYTLKHVENLLWLVIEDANVTSPLVQKTLNRIGVPYEYLLAPMPEKYKTKKGAKPRGVSNRNLGIEWVRRHAVEGALYFADDDNTYDISIFEQIRYTKKVSMWPVGLVTNLGISSPIVKGGKIIGFYDWIGGRRYPVDMAGFAVGVKFLLERPKAKMPFSPGYEEDGFIKSLEPLKLAEIELLASGCTEVLVWHTQSKKNPSAAALNMTKYGDTNLVSTDKHLVRKVT